MAITFVSTARCGGTIPAGFCVSLMGGGTYCLPQLPYVQNPLVAYLKALRDWGMMLMPLVPLLVVINLLIAIKDFIVDLPANVASAIGLNPSPLADSANRVVVAAAAIVSLANPLIAFSQMVRGVILFLRGFLVALKSQLLIIVAKYARIASALTTANRLSIASMIQNAQCAKANMDQKLAAVIASMGPIATIIGFVNILLCLMGSSIRITPVVLPTTLSAEIIDAALDPPIAILDGILALIPNVPGVTFEC